MIKNTQETIYHCDICGREETQKMAITPEGGSYFIPCIPQNWYLIRFGHCQPDRLVCNKHKIYIDGEVEL